MGERVDGWKDERMEGERMKIWMLKSEKKTGRLKAGSLKG